MDPLVLFVCLAVVVYMAKLFVAGSEPVSVDETDNNNDQQWDSLISTLNVRNVQSDDLTDPETDPIDVVPDHQEPTQDVTRLIPMTLEQHRPQQVFCVPGHQSPTASSVVVIRRFDGSRMRLTDLGNRIEREILTRHGSKKLKSVEGLTLREAIDREQDVHNRLAGVLFRLLPQHERHLSWNGINALCHVKASGPLPSYQRRPMATRVNVLEAVRRALLIRLDNIGTRFNV